MLIDVAGFLLGHVTKGDTGCSVVIAPNGAFAGVDVRGEAQAPGKPTF